MGCKQCAKAEAWPTQRSSNSCSEHDHDAVVATDAVDAGAIATDAVYADASAIHPNRVPLDQKSSDVVASSGRPADGSPRPTSILTGSASTETKADGRTDVSDAGDDDDLAIFKRRSPGRPTKHSAARAANGSRDGLNRDGLTRDMLARGGQGYGRSRGAHQAGKRRPSAAEEAIGSYAPATRADAGPSVDAPAARAMAAQKIDVPKGEVPKGDVHHRDGNRIELQPTADANAPAEVAAEAPAPVTADHVAGRVDVFDRTLRVAVAEARLRLEALGRQVPVLRRIVGAGQAVLLVARCGPLDQSNATDHLLVVTRDRVVVTSQSRSLHRTRVHLNAAVAALLNVRWQPDVGSASVEFAATALDGVRERFLIEAPDAAAVSHVDAVLGYVFRPAGTRRFNPVEPVMPSWMNPAGAY